jgi:hypothetical protein
MQRGRLWGEAASFYEPSGQGVRGMGMAAPPTTERYGRFKQTQLDLGLRDLWAASDCDLGRDSSSPREMRGKCGSVIYITGWLLNSG